MEIQNDNGCVVGKLNDHFSEVIRVLLDENAIDLQPSVMIEEISLC
jgi:hypothetical protein